MQAGRLDRRITLKTVTETQDTAGQVTRTLTDLATVWAEKRTTGRELWRAQQVNAEVSAVYVIRYRSDVSPDMRIYDTEDGLDYDILAINEIGRREGLEIHAKAWNLR